MKTTILLVLSMFLISSCGFTKPPYLTAVPDGKGGYKIIKSDIRPPGNTYRTRRGTVYINGKSYRYRYKGYK